MLLLPWVAQEQLWLGWVCVEALGKGWALGAQAEVFASTTQKRCMCASVLFVIILSDRS